MKTVFHVEYCKDDNNVVVGSIVEMGVRYHLDKLRKIKGVTIKEKTKKIKINH